MGLLQIKKNRCFVKQLKLKKILNMKFSQLVDFVKKNAIILW